MIDSSLKSQIKGFLEGFVQGFVNEAKSSSFSPKELRPLRSSSKDGDLKPFHESLLPDGILRISEFERSFSTRLGSSFEECARMIASANHAQAVRGYRLTGTISAAAVKRIEHFNNETSSGGMHTPYLKMVDEVVMASGKGGGENRQCIADLFIETKTGEEFYFEIKSPKPNKGQCLEATSRLLHIQAITHQKYPRARAYYATAYNPYGTEKSSYRHSFLVNYMDIRDQVLIGSEFWNLVGGDGTYEEILQIYQEVGREKGPDMLDQLALGY